ncbi:hypothetical protein C2G38_2160803 [Gigaspora rosea]|uniref:Uncharacterized protein n=1 Tax=Gigaspora rosea TaxID=44941 RepID=A0A397VXT1_9GLOM|nr:hypothetical protein C2G38_2160803 [Gigaspora rosea]
MNTKQFQQFIEMITKSLESQNGSMIAPKENNNITVKGFYSTDEEDPFECFDELKHATEANNWSWKTKDEDERERKKFLSLVYRAFCTTQMAISMANRDLNKAIAVAKKVKVGDNYGQHPNKAHKSQQKLEKHSQNNYQGIESLNSNIETIEEPKNINFCKLVYNNKLNNPEVYNIGNDNMPKITKRPIDPSRNKILKERKKTNACIHFDEQKLYLQYANKTIEISISNTGTKSLNPHKEEEYNSKGGSTFDEFNYKENKR